MEAQRDPQQPCSASGNSNGGNPGFFRYAGMVGNQARPQNYGTMAGGRQQAPGRFPAQQQQQQQQYRGNRVDASPGFAGASGFYRGRSEGGAGAAGQQPYQRQAYAARNFAAHRPRTNAGAAASTSPAQNWQHSNAPASVVSTGATDLTSAQRSPDMPQNSRTPPASARTLPRNDSSGSSESGHFNDRKTQGTPNFQEQRKDFNGSWARRNGSFNSGTMQRGTGRMKSGFSGSGRYNNSQNQNMHQNHSPQQHNQEASNSASPGGQVASNSYRSVNSASANGSTAVHRNSSSMYGVSKAKVQRPHGNMARQRSASFSLSQRHPGSPASVQDFDQHQRAGYVNIGTDGPNNAPQIPGNHNQNGAWNNPFRENAQGHLAGQEYAHAKNSPSSAFGETAMQDYQVLSPQSKSSMRGPQSPTTPPTPPTPPANTTPQGGRRNFSSYGARDPNHRGAGNSGYGWNSQRHNTQPRGYQNDFTHNNRNPHQEQRLFHEYSKIDAQEWEQKFVQLNMGSENLRIDRIPPIICELRVEDEENPVHAISTPCVLISASNLDTTGKCEKSDKEALRAVAAKSGIPSTKGAHKDAHSIKASSTETATSCRSNYRVDFEKNRGSVKWESVPCIGWGAWKPEAAAIDLERTWINFLEKSIIDEIADTSLAGAAALLESKSQLAAMEKSVPKRPSAATAASQAAGSQAPTRSPRLQQHEQGSVYNGSYSRGAGGAPRAAAAAASDTRNFVRRQPQQAAHHQAPRQNMQNRVASALLHQPASSAASVRDVGRPPKPPASAEIMPATTKSPTASAAAPGVGKNCASSAVMRFEDFAAACPVPARRNW